MRSISCGIPTPPNTLDLDELDSRYDAEMLTKVEPVLREGVLLGEDFIVGDERGVDAAGEFVFVVVAQGNPQLFVLMICRGLHEDSGDMTSDRVDDCRIIVEVLNASSKYPAELCSPEISGAFTGVAGSLPRSIAVCARKLEFPPHEKTPNEDATMSRGRESDRVDSPLASEIDSRGVIQPSLDLLLGRRVPMDRCSVATTPRDDFASAIVLDSDMRLR